MNGRPPPPKIEPSSLVIAAVIFYALMAVGGWVALVVSDLNPHDAIFGRDSGDPRPLGGFESTILGAGSAIAIVLVTRFTRNLGPMQKMQREFASVLGPLETPAIAVLALTSAIGEEVLFRGALQPLIGFWPTVVIFGLLHGGGAPRLWLWTLFALVAGLLLGWLADYTGHLLAPILCHFTVNFWNLHALVAQAPRDESSSEGSEDTQDDEEQP